MIDEEPKYLSKPTVIVCNPNAFYYQQMITAPNAYWLNFFLKRDINVVCWNYRGYGESENSWFNSIDPFKSKQDVEYVLAYTVNNLKVRGKLGVYGRSIGGLTAYHLASKYKDLIKLLVVDRSMDEILSVINLKIRGMWTKLITNTLSCCWRTKNDSNFIDVSSDCFKIITCDPLDDTVDVFGNLCTGVASKVASLDYNQ